MRERIALRDTDKVTVFKRYRNAVRNTKNFNRGLVDSKKVKYTNGEKTEFFRKNIEVRDIFFREENGSYVFGFVDYPGSSKI